MNVSLTRTTQPANQAAHDSPAIPHCHRPRVPSVALLAPPRPAVSALVPPPTKHHRKAVINKRSNLHGRMSFALADLRNVNLTPSSGSFFTLPASHPTLCKKTCRNTTSSHFTLYLVDTACQHQCVTFCAQCSTSCVTFHLMLVISRRSVDHWEYVCE